MKRKSPTHHSQKSDLLDGKSLGQLLAEGFEELATTIQQNPEEFAEKFTCHRMTLNLKPQTYSPALVKQTREMLGASQQVFAQFLGVAVNTVHAWEQGINTPRESARRLMDEIQHNPPYFRARLRESMVSKSGNVSRRKAT